jgi:hypothetical protein
MGRRTRTVLLACAAASFAAPAALHPVTVLEVENASRGTASRLVLPGGAPFSVRSWHSMYDQPVTEEFIVGDKGRIVLVAVSSPSAAVLEYFGITSPGQRHRIERAMEQIVFRVAMGTPQRLIWGAQERSFLELGDPGDRLVMRAIRKPALAHWFTGS